MGKLQKPATTALRVAKNKLERGLEGPISVIGSQKVRNKKIPQGKDWGKLTSAAQSARASRGYLVFAHI